VDLHRRQQAEKEKYFLAKIEEQEVEVMQLREQARQLKEEYVPQ